jgi:hypothetical protein
MSAQGRSRCFYVSRHDPVAQHVNDRDDILLNTGIQQTGQRRIASQHGDVTLDQIANVRGQLGNSRF